MNSTAFLLHPGGISRLQLLRTLESLIERCERIGVIVPSEEMLRELQKPLAGFVEYFDVGKQVFTALPSAVRRQPNLATRTLNLRPLGGCQFDEGMRGGPPAAAAARLKNKR